MDVSAEKHFTDLAETYERHAHEAETSRNGSDMHINRWKADVCRRILKGCSSDARLDEAQIGQVTKWFTEDYNFTYEGGRDLGVQHCTKMMAAEKVE